MTGNIEYKKAGDVYAIAGEVFGVCKSGGLVRVGHSSQAAFSSDGFFETAFELCLEEPLALNLEVIVFFLLLSATSSGSGFGVNNSTIEMIAASPRLTSFLITLV